MKFERYFLNKEGDELAVREHGQNGAIASKCVADDRDLDRITGLVAAANACDGIPVEALRAGIIVSMFEALYLSLRFVESVEVFFAAADREEEAAHARHFKDHVTKLISLAYGERFREGLKLQVLELLAAETLTRQQLDAALRFDLKFVLGDIEHDRLIVGDTLEIPPGNRKFAITNRGFAALQAAKTVAVGGAT